jgi:chromosome segregation ATPase
VLLFTATHTFESLIFADKDRAAELQTTIESIESRLLEQETDANKVITQWQDNCAELEKSGAELEQRLVDAESAHSGDQLQIAELTATLQEVEKNKSVSDETVRIIRADLKRKENEISVFEAKLTKASASSNSDELLQNKLAELESQGARLSDELENERQARRVEHDGLMGELTQERAAHFETREEASTLRQELEDARIEGEDIVNQWTGKCFENVIVTC